MHVRPSHGVPFPLVFLFGVGKNRGQQRGGMFEDSKAAQWIVCQHLTNLTYSKTALSKWDSMDYGGQRNQLVQKEIQSSKHSYLAKSSTWQTQKYQKRKKNLQLVFFYSPAKQGILVNLDIGNVLQYTKCSLAVLDLWCNIPRERDKDTKSKGVI